MLIICKSRIIRIDFYTFYFRIILSVIIHNSQIPGFFHELFPLGIVGGQNFFYICVKDQIFGYIINLGGHLKKNRLHPQVVRLQQISVIIGKQRVSIYEQKNTDYHNGKEQCGKVYGIQLLSYFC